uniref:ribosomal protein L33 n=1 Tax=Ampelocalamus sinovietnamensis TaxID=2943534 RepID=UPI002028C190|nr:ribosomal protein L33 [Ampelocalamus sinovietnamensis]UQK95074.1 ribosomal protein L33 [Ampelocalamus sinovietnamensis]
MAKGKGVRIRVILECISCVRKGANEESTGISRFSRYSTQKNRHNTPGQLELKKFCRYCRKHTTHDEIKK